MKRLLIVLPLMLTGCVPAPYVTTSSPTSISVCHGVHPTARQTALNIAVQHCAVRGLVPRRKGAELCGLGNEFDTYFECVETPK